jgi:hypothetical protein
MAALIAGTAFFFLAMLFWYGIGLVMKPETQKNPLKEKETRTPLHARIDQMLAETIRDKVGPEFMAPPPTAMLQN